MNALRQKTIWLHACASISSRAIRLITDQDVMRRWSEAVGVHCAPRGLEILVPQVRRQRAERSLAVQSGARFGDRGGAAVARVDLDARAVEPARLLERHRDRQRLFAGRARNAPDSHGRAGCRAQQFRQHVACQRPNLVGLAPEVRLLHRQRVHHVAPGRVGGPVVEFQQVVEIEIRPEAARDHQRRQSIAQQLAAAVLVEQPRLLVNQLAQKRQAGFGDAEVLG